MNRILMTSEFAALIAASCSKGFTKKHEARFKVNGTQYNCGEDAVSASYYNSDVNYL